MLRLIGMRLAKHGAAVALAAAVAAVCAPAMAQTPPAVTEPPRAVEGAATPDTAVDPAAAATDAPNSPVPGSRPSPVPPAPGEPRAAKAYAVLETYCARCHQTGRLKVPAAARPVANILDLDDLARQRSLVQPGLPDASPLYTVMLRHHSTVDIESEPQADAIQAVRDWIQDLDADVGRCPERRPVLQAAVNKAVAETLATVSSEKAKELRFISLAHLYNACTDPAVMARYRQAIGKVVNSLSWAPEPVRLETIDAAETIIKLDLAQIGWVGAHWEKLVAASPYTGLASTSLSDAERRRTGTLVPVVRGDWFADAAMTAPLYPALLGLPGRHVNLQRILNVDTEANIKLGAARRAAVQTSAVTRANRLVERHPTRIGSLWMTYDFATSDGRQNLAANPLGPVAGGVVKVPFKHDGSKSLFTLPNGFFAYSLNDARGDRIDQSPETVEREETMWAGPVINGGSCLGCHRTGPVGVTDMVRSQITADTAAPKELREAILALYPLQDEMANLVVEDQERYAAAQRRAGIDPDALVQGLEPVAALARAYTQNVDLDRLAAELGVSVGGVKEQLARLPVELQLSVRRLKLGLASRAEADRILVRLGADGGMGGRAAVVLDAPGERVDMELLLWMSSDSYEVGDLAAIFARANQNCYLTLISIDGANRATVLFPNEFEQNNLLQAGKEFRLPSEAAPYQFRLKNRGRETVAGMCSTASKVVDGIAHDFERQRFTMLGDWRAFLGQINIEASRQQPAALETARTVTKPQRRGRTKPAVAEPKGDPKAEATRAVIDVQARAAVSYEVR